MHFNILLKSLSIRLPSLLLITVLSMTLCLKLGPLEQSLSQGFKAKQFVECWAQDALGTGRKAATQV